MRYRWVRRDSMWANLVSYELVGDGADGIWGRVDMLRDRSGWRVVVPGGMSDCVYADRARAMGAAERARGIGRSEVER